MTEHYKTPYQDFDINKGDPTEFNLRALQDGGFGPASEADLDKALDGISSMSDQSQEIVKNISDRTIDIALLKDMGRLAAETGEINPHGLEIGEDGRWYGP